jgi:hypothetical protein
MNNSARFWLTNTIVWTKKYKLITAKLIIKKKKKKKKKERKKE